MAENAAHNTATSESKPSIFEIIAQKSLDSTLYPAFERICQFLAASFPNKCDNLPNYSDEIFLFLKGALEYYYLKRKDTSFSEYFYGLRRVSVLQTNPDDSSKFQKWSSLLFLVLVPYIKRKLDNKIEQYKLQNIDGIYKNNLDKNYKKSVVFLYTSGELFWRSWTLVQYLRYIANKTEVQLPDLWLLNLKLVYSEDQQDVSGFWTVFFKGQLSSSEILSGILQNGLASIWEITAFFLQFLRVWNSEKMNYSIASLPKVPPPLLDVKAEIYKEKCPLCLQSQKIPTVIPVSGYVFCFSCILRYLKEHSRCPVTNLPANPLDIVRIYD